MNGILKTLLPLLLATATEIIRRNKDAKFVEWLFSPQVRNTIEDFTSVYIALALQKDSEDAD